MGGFGATSVVGSVGYALVLSSYASDLASRGWPWRNAHVLGVAGYAVTLAYLVTKQAAPGATKAQKVTKSVGAGLLLAFLAMQALGFAIHEPAMHDVFGAIGQTLVFVPGQARVSAAFLAAYYALSAFQHCGDPDQSAQCLGRAALFPYYLETALDPSTR